MSITIKWVIITASLFCFLGCEKQSTTLETDYNYPFGIDFSMESTLLKGKEYLLVIDLTNKGSLANPNNSYTFSYTADGVTILNSENLIFTPNTDYDFTYENIPVLRVIAKDIGRKTLNLTIKNKQGYQVNKTITLDVVESTMNIKTTQTIFNTYTDTDIAINFSVAQDIPGALFLSFDNIASDVTLKLNGQEISKDVNLSIAANESYQVSMSFKAVGTYNPKINLSDGTTVYPIELSATVKARELIFTDLAMQYRRGIDAGIRFNIKGLVEYDPSNVYNITANIETVSKSLKVIFKSSAAFIKEINYNGKSYQYGEEILLNTPSDLSKINLFFKDAYFGDMALDIAVIDEFGTQSKFLQTNFVYYKAPTISGNLSMANEVNFLIFNDILDKKLLESNEIKIESLGNPIVSIDYNVNLTGTAIYLGLPTIEFKAIDKQKSVVVNAESFKYKYALNQQMLSAYNINYARYRLATAAFQTSSFVIYRLYGDPVILNTNN